MLTIAQITDIHLCSGTDSLRKVRAKARLVQALRAIMALQPRPAAIVASGDLTQGGDASAYADFWHIVAAETDIPVYPALGNHDVRSHFVEASLWPQGKLASGFLQYAADIAPDLRLVVCDTVDDGQHDAAFCDVRARWLRETLDAAPDRPTLVALHHPPIMSGIQWMDPPSDAPWIQRLHACLSGRSQVKGIMCGHLHRAFTGVFAGHMVTVAPATDIQLTLNLTAIDRQAPDGREILLEEPPGFALHMWSGGGLTTHFCLAGPYPSAVHFHHPLEPA